MAIPAYATPYGLRDIKLVNFATVPVVADLPAARQLKYTERAQSDEMKGDDVVIAKVSFPEALDWEIEAGGISLEAYALITGRLVVTTGVSPSVVKTLSATSDSIDYPYIKIYGKSMGGRGDDVHVKIYYAKLEEIEGEIKGEEFAMTKCKGVAIYDDSGKLYDIVHNETAAALPAS